MIIEKKMFVFFYNRDRNEENVNFRTHIVSNPSDIARAVLLINEEEYAYLYDCNDNMGVWYFAKHGKFCGVLTEDSVKKINIMMGIINLLIILPAISFFVMIYGWGLIRQLFLSII